MRRNEFNNYLKEKNFNGFFNELGWDNVPNNLRINPITIEEKEYQVKPVADKQGFKALICLTDEIPQHTVRKKIDFQLRKYFHNYILIFTKENSEHQLWVVPVKTVEKRDLVIVEYQNPEQADFLFSKLANFSFGLDEEITIIDITIRVHGAFEINSEKVTKDFYAGFKKHHTAFAKFVEGITVEGDRQWYASVMLNRLMFCYFIQKKGFLNFDTDYLRNKLAWTKEQQGDDQFFGTFYKGFLTVLFHGGLNSPQHDADFRQKYGRIPYLNGGLFDVHQLEEDYTDIDIPDKAFEDLFDFFDKWRWHLDTRIEATGKDINPDVLGYIFEQYINDRAQMGAYYTKEDITEYIGKNCIIPFLMDETAKTTSKKHFTPGGFIWETLRNSDDRYIYDAVKKGTDIKELPEEIAIGLNTDEPDLLERRKDWNRPTPEEYALPTEIWRETIERRNRYAELLNKIRNGEITQINDFITYNLDIRLFVEDLLIGTTDHQFILHFYKALQGVTILDPTCGSGAFLFASLNILEPLYEICINRMQEFNAENPLLFKEQLQEIDQKYRSNIQYFIYKSIILRNLYGVDIMHEATEIARLRLFLKMVAVVDVNRRADNLGLDPLPDIDFNIRCGNTLIGYATQQELDNDLAYGDMFANMEFKEKINEEMEKVALAYQHFKNIQLSQHENMEAFKTAKSELNNRLNKLNDTLNKRLYASTVVGNTLDYDDWLTSHQPFHWLAEFYEIMQGKGGFDVVVGNPPYVEYSTRKFEYKLNPVYYNTYQSRNLYSYIFERSKIFLKNYSRIGMIVQISSISTPTMESMCQEVKRNSINNWISNYATRPSYLFDGVCMNLTIILSEIGNNIKSFYSTKYLRWNPVGRAILFKNIKYNVFDESAIFFPYSLPKLTSSLELDLIMKVKNNKKTLGNYLETTKRKTKQELFYRTAGGRYFKLFLDKDFGSESKSNKSKYFVDKYNVHVIISVLSSNLWWWYYTLHFDMYNCKDYMMYSFHFDYSNLSENMEVYLSNLGEKLSKNLFENAQIKQQTYNTTGERTQLIFKPALSKPIIDEIDKVLARHYGFTEEELDFIINYDIKYRMGSELNAEEE